MALQGVILETGRGDNVSRGAAKDPESVITYLAYIIRYHTKLLLFGSVVPRSLDHAGV